jgi:hypothetical protein
MWERLSSREIKGRGWKAATTDSRFNGKLVFLDNQAK